MTNNYLEILKKYEKALELLDQYDHQDVSKPKGTNSIKSLSYQETRNLIDSMKFSDSSSVFGVEKENGKLNGILESIELTAFNKSIYSSLEEKAANLLYFLIKDHPFVDGCKRIAASIFLIYLHKNNALLIDGFPSLSNGTLASLVLLIAESKPEEKDIMIKIIMSILSYKM